MPGSTEHTGSAKYIAALLSRRCDGYQRQAANRDLDRSQWSQIRYCRGRRRCAQPGRVAAAFPNERLCPDVYTIHIVKERSAGAQKNPVGVNRPGSLVGASLEGSSFEPSRENALEGLSNQYLTIRGERIAMVKRGMCRYGIHTGQARATVPVDVGIRLPAPFGGAC